MESMSGSVRYYVDTPGWLGPPISMSGSPAEIYMELERSFSFRPGDVRLHAINATLQERIRGHRPLTFICSPFSGLVERNVAYAKDAMRDALKLGWAAYAPHLIFPEYLDDSIPDEREMGIVSGMTLLDQAEILAVYCDFGVTAGMRREIDRHYDREHLGLQD